MEVVKKLIQAEDVNEKNERGLTPLHLASAHGHVEVVKRLIQAGGEVNQKCKSGWTQDEDGSTPLHEASRNGHVDVITALLSAGADKTIKNEDGSTPYVYAKNQATRNALE